MYTLNRLRKFEDDSFINLVNIVYSAIVSYIRNTTGLETRPNIE